jgi:restriction-modification system family protein
MDDDVTGRSYARVYHHVRRRDHHRFVEEAVERAGGRVLAASKPSHAPLFLGIEDDRGERLAICAYVFLANRREIRNRPRDEHRLQIRYGDINNPVWRAENHSVGFDPLSVDVTLILGAHVERNLFIGLDPLVYDPLPIGISIFFKEAEINKATRSGWHVWERDNISGKRRTDPRTTFGVETVIAVAPERLLDYVRFERAAQSLRLDPPLRFRAAEDAAVQRQPEDIHHLEREFALTREEILDIIRERPRLGMAVRGGVAERHLHKHLNADRSVIELRLGMQEGPPDFFVRLGSRRQITVECKNASPIPYADGTPKVETQKTRASKGDPRSRLYHPTQFDVVAACMYGPWQRWEFRFKRSDSLERDAAYPDRIAAIQRIDGTWASSLTDAIRL